MDAAEKYKNRHRAVIEYANGAMFNIAELDRWAIANKRSLSFEQLFANCEYVLFEHLAYDISCHLVPEDMPPDDARRKLRDAHDTATPDDPVSRYRDLVMVRFDNELLAAVYDDKLNLFDTLTYGKIDVEAARLGYNENPDAYLEGSRARILARTKPHLLEQAVQRAKEHAAQQETRKWGYQINPENVSVKLLPIDEQIAGIAKEAELWMTPMNWAYYLAEDLAQTNEWEGEERKKKSGVAQAEYINLFVGNATSLPLVQELTGTPWTGGALPQYWLERLHLKKTDLARWAQSYAPEIAKSQLFGAPTKTASVLSRSEPQIPDTDSPLTASEPRAKHGIEPNERDLSLIDVTLAQWKAATSDQRQRIIKNIEATKENSRQVARQDNERIAKGRYTLKQAAELLEKEGDERQSAILRKLCDAALAGDLPVYEPGRNARYEYGPGKDAKQVRDFYEEARWDELNTWLAKDDQRHITFRFPLPSQDKPQSTASVPTPATGAEQKAEQGAQEKTWQEWARHIADEFFDRDTGNSVRDSLASYSDRTATEMRSREIKGPQGWLSGAYIKRNALQGARWWQGKKK